LKEATASAVTFDTTTLEKLLCDPHGVLDCEDEFWQRERAQVLTVKWAELVGYPISREQWRSQVASWAALPPHERESHPAVRSYRSIIERRADFLSRALPHVRSYLPGEADISAKVQFTAFIPPRAFAVEDIVINVAATYWKGNADNILSCLIHELGHVGHSWCRGRGGDDGLAADENLCTMLYGLQGEGFCDYVAYQARHEFPAPDELDFQLYESPAEVRRQMGIFNEVLSSASATPPAEFTQLIWDKCIQGRAYYIAGMHCCHSIIENLGRDALFQTLIDGPLSFVDLYNSLVGGDMRVRLPE
jgi:hypothetical protein